MKALVLTTKMRYVSVKDIPRPEPKDRQVVIRVRAVALNPVETLFSVSPLAHQATRVVGTDFAGEVVQVGAALVGEDDPRHKIGARVAGFLQGACSANDLPGAFAEYVAADSDLLWHVPDQVSLEEASAISMCGYTAVQVVYDRLGLPSPFAAPTPGSLGSTHDGKFPAALNVLIYGATTSVGLYAAQLVRLSEPLLPPGTKLRLFGVASSKHQQLLSGKPYAYDVLMDYKDADWTQKLRQATGGDGIHLALDSISEGDTVGKVDSVLAEDGKLALVRSPAFGAFDCSKLRTKPLYVLAWGGLGHEFVYNDGIVFPASPAERDHCVRFFKYLGSGASTGSVKLQSNPVRIMPGGLDMIAHDGFYLLGSGNVADRGVVAFEAVSQLSEEHMRPISGEKIVYRV